MLKYREYFLHYLVQEIMRRVNEIRAQESAGERRPQASARFFTKVRVPILGGVHVRDIELSTSISSVDPQAAYNYQLSIYWIGPARLSGQIEDILRELPLRLGWIDTSYLNHVDCQLDLHQDSSSKPVRPQDVQALTIAARILELITPVLADVEARLEDGKLNPIELSMTSCRVSSQGNQFRDIMFSVVDLSLANRTAEVLRSLGYDLEHDGSLITFRINYPS